MGSPVKLNSINVSEDKWRRRPTFTNGIQDQCHKGHLIAKIKTIRT